MKTSVLGLYVLAATAHFQCQDLKLLLHAIWLLVLRKRIYDVCKIPPSELPSQVMLCIFKRP